MDPAGIIVLVGTLGGGAILALFEKFLRQEPEHIEYYSAKAVLEAADKAGPIDWTDPLQVDAVHQRISAEISAYGAAKTLCYCWPCADARDWETWINKEEDFNERHKRRMKAMKKKEAQLRDSGWGIKTEKGYK